MERAQACSGWRASTSEPRNNADIYAPWLTFSCLSNRDERSSRGADFNAARHFDEVYKRNVYGWFFAEMAKKGLYDCHWNLHAREVQSFWGRGLEKYQDDHFFVDAASAERVKACQVIDNDHVRKLSDHGPIELLLADS